ncbi:MAG TPA: hypothetical protein VFT21_05865 [Gemmatimonadaceae bacterium]|nr:hypothetical protein [Gemmatimonadaceae bacterium]
MNTSSKKAALMALVLAPLVLAATSSLHAMVVRTTLGELVEQSELVMYGVTTTHQDDQAARDESTVWFKSESLLKAPKGLPSGDIPICEDSARSDTINLREYPGSYVVFATKRGKCFAPVAGYKSLIPVNEGVARTLDIDEQPRTEPLDVFFAKIRKLLPSVERKQ